METLNSSNKEKFLPRDPKDLAVNREKYDSSSHLNPEFASIPKISVAGVSLIMILLIRIVNEWQQKSLGYFYGFQGAGLLAGNPKYELSTAFP